MAEVLLSNAADHIITVAAGNNDLVFFTKDRAPSDCSTGGHGTSYDNIFCRTIQI